MNSRASRKAFSKWPTPSSLPESGWRPTVMTASAHMDSGIDAVWKTILTFYDQMTTNGIWSVTRSFQQVAWFKDHFQYLINTDIDRSGALRDLSQTLEQ